MRFEAADQHALGALVIRVDEFNLNAFHDLLRALLHRCGVDGAGVNGIGQHADGCYREISKIVHRDNMAHDARHSARMRFWPFDRDPNTLISALLAGTEASSATNPHLRARNRRGYHRTQNATAAIAAQSA